MYSSGRCRPAGSAIEHDLDTLPGVRRRRIVHFVLLRFVETPIFTEEIVRTLADSEYAELQAALILQPDLGEVIPGTGGLRKMRWGLPAQDRGKRGGIRVIYYWYMSQTLIYLLMVYPKSKRDDLSDRQKKMLRKIAEGFK
jgi:hypothetical protein